jgi:hypothetical protein
MCYFVVSSYLYTTTTTTTNTTATTTTTTLLTCTWITFEYQYTLGTRSLGVLSTSDAIMDWKEYLYLSLSLVITTSCACQTFILLFHFKGMADPFWNGSDVLSLAKHSSRLHCSVQIPMLYCIWWSAVFYYPFPCFYTWVFYLEKNCSAFIWSMTVSERTSLLHLTPLKHNGYYMYHLL